MTDRPDNRTRRLLRALAALLLIDIGVLCVLGFSGFLYEELTASLLLGAMYTVIALVAVTLMRRGCNMSVMGGAIVLSYAACGLAINLFYRSYRYDNDLENLLLRLTWSLTIIAILIVYRGGMQQIDAKTRPVRISRDGVMSTALVFAILLLILIWFGERMFAFGFMRGWIFEYIVMSVLLILGGVTLIGPSVVRMLSQRERKRFDKAENIVSSRALVELDCPKCGLPLSVAAGPGRCDACGFTMLIEIEEPRCDCGYLIYEHTSEHCPECGRTIPEQDRWAPAQSSES